MTFALSLIEEDADGNVDITENPLLTKAILGYPVPLLLAFPPMQPPEIIMNDDLPFDSKQAALQWTREQFGTEVQKGYEFMRAQVHQRHQHADLSPFPADELWTFEHAAELAAICQVLYLNPTRPAMRSASCSYATSSSRG